MPVIDIMQRGDVLVKRTVHDNGILETDFCAIGRSSPWPPTYNSIEATMNWPKQQDRDWLRDLGRARACGTI